MRAGKKKPNCYGGGCNECTVYCGHCTVHCTAGVGATSVSRIWAVEWVTCVLSALSELEKLVNSELEDWCENILSGATNHKVSS